MQTEYIDLIEETPTLHTQKCKLIALGIRVFLQFTTFVVPIIVWFIYDFFLAAASLLLSFIVMGIIRSKIRNSVIPISQLEFQYTDKEIANWYSAKTLCFEEDTTTTLS